METSQRMSLKFKNEPFVLERHHFGADNDHSLGLREEQQIHFLKKKEWTLLFSPLQLWPRMGKRKLNTWSPLVARTQRFVTSRLWMPAAGKMEEQLSVPNVSIPCHDEQRDKKKRYTVRAQTLFWFSLNLTFASRVWIFSVFPRFTKCWSAWGSRNGLSSDATQSLINCITQWVAKQCCFQACGSFHFWFMWSLWHFLLLL